LPLFIERYLEGLVFSETRKNIEGGGHKGGYLELLKPRLPCIGWSSNTLDESVVGSVKDESSVFATLVVRSVGPATWL